MSLFLSLSLFESVSERYGSNNAQMMPVFIQRNPVDSGTPPQSIATPMTQGAAPVYVN
jgi:hypothetical protein